MNINEKLSSALSIVQAAKSKISNFKNLTAKGFNNPYRDPFPESAPGQTFDVLDNIRNPDIEIIDIANPSGNNDPFAPDPMQFFGVLHPDIDSSAPASNPRDDDYPDPNKDDEPAPSPVQDNKPGTAVEDRPGDHHPGVGDGVDESKPDSNPSGGRTDGPGTSGTSSSSGSSSSSSSSSSGGRTDGPGTSGTSSSSGSDSSSGSSSSSSSSGSSSSSSGSGGRSDGPGTSGSSEPSGPGGNGGV